MDDLRSEPRNHLAYYLRVLEQDGKTLFGHVVDVSSGGMLITSQRPVQRARQYRLLLEEIGDTQSPKTVPFIAECRWCREDSGLFDAGFKLVRAETPLRELLAEAV